MARRIVHEGAQGGTVVTVLAADAELDHALRRLGLRGGDYLLVEDEDAPSTAFGLGAWRRRGSRVEVDMEAARTAHMAQIRRLRDRALAQADIDWMKAMDEGDSARARRIGARRQRLRDIPQSFNMGAAATPAALQALWPEGLERPEEAGRKR